MSRQQLLEPKLLSKQLLTRQTLLNTQHRVFFIADTDKPSRKNHTNPRFYPALAWLQDSPDFDNATWARALSPDWLPSVTTTMRPEFVDGLSVSYIIL